MTKQETRVLDMVRRLDRMCASFHKREKALREEIETAQKKLKTCSHSDTVSFRWESDNGYGRQSMHDGLRCRICGKENRPSVSGSWY